MEAVNLAQAKARLSELVGRAAAGEDVCISKRGEPIVRLVPVKRPKPPIDWDSIDQLRESLPQAPDVMTVAEMRRLDLL